MNLLMFDNVWFDFNTIVLSNSVWFPNKNFIAYLYISNYKTKYHNKCNFESHKHIQKTMKKEKRMFNATESKEYIDQIKSYNVLKMCNKDNSE